MNGNDLMGVTNFMLAAAHNSGAAERESDKAANEAADRILEKPDFLAEALYEGYSQQYTNAKLGRALKAFIDGDTDPMSELIGDCVAWYAQEAADSEREFEERAEKTREIE